MIYKNIDNCGSPHRRIILFIYFFFHIKKQTMRFLIKNRKKKRYNNVQKNSRLYVHILKIKEKKSNKINKK